MVSRVLNTESKKIIRHPALLYGASAVILVVLMQLPAFAADPDILPTGAEIRSGAASFDYDIPDQLHVHQTSDRVFIDWDSFNIGQNALTQFHQNNSGSLAVNRVVGDGMDPTRILGTLKANGQVIVLDQNGIIFGKDAIIDVGSIIAAAGNMDIAKTMYGNEPIEITNINSQGFVINEGSITVADAGLAAFVAPTLINNGTINAKLGRVQIGGGDRATIDLYGDGLMSVTLDKGRSQALINNGAISAEGGQIQITAATAKDIVNNLILNTGVITVDSFSQDKAGKIILSAGSSHKTDAQGGSITANQGLITAVSHEEKNGGQIDVLGDAVILDSGSVIDASGISGGGNIRIGGDYLGQGKTPTAKYVYINQDAYIFNDAILNGDGGRTIVWSDDTTDFYGNIFGRGGILGGNGGFTETSGKQNLLAQGYVDLTAPHGNKGTYLLDPADITIYGNFTPNDIAGLELWLDPSDSANVNLTYNSMASTANGISGTNVITVSSNAGLQVGARVRLGTNGSTTTANVIGSDTYKITNIAGNVITLDTNLSTTYSATTVYQGYISQLTDKSAKNNNAVQVTNARMPLWVGDSLNGLAMANYDGNDDAIAFTQISNIRSAFLTLNNTGKPAYATFLGHTVSGPSFHGSNTANDLFDATYTDPSILSGQGYIDGRSVTPISMQVSSAYKNIGLITIANTLADDVGNDRLNFGRAWRGNFGDVIVYNTVLSTDNRNLIEQYQSAKWNLALDPLAAAGTEAAEAMDATNGYGVFTTRYLERLSNTADILLQAGNSISLDFKGDTLNLADNRSITLTTGTGDIRTLSAGGITTNRTAAGGNITFNSGHDIAINHAFVMNAQNSGAIQLNAASTITAPGGLTILNGTLTADSQNITGIYTGRNAVLKSNAGNINATVSFENLDISGAAATLLGGYIGTTGPSTQAMADLVKINGSRGSGNPAYTFGGFKIGYAPPSNPALDKASTLTTGQTQSSMIEEKNKDTATKNDAAIENAVYEAEGKPANRSGSCLVTYSGAGCIIQ